MYAIRSYYVRRIHTEQGESLEVAFSGIPHPGAVPFGSGIIFLCQASGLQTGEFINRGNVLCCDIGTFLTGFPAFGPVACQEIDLGGDQISYNFV